MKLRTKGTVLLETLIFTSLLLSVITATVLANNEKQFRGQLTYWIEKSILVASNEMKITSTKICTDFAEPIEMRCLVEDGDWRNNGLIHQLESDGLIIKWPKIGRQTCDNNRCENEHSIFIPALAR